MQTYTAPLRDMRFVLHELHGGIHDNAEFTPELLDTILEEAGKFCSEVLLPLNASGDIEGCHFENGVVRTPAGFKEAYEAFNEAGWGAVGAPPEFGGQGLPHAVTHLIEEMLCGCNLSFGMYPGLTQGACRALEKHGSEELKALYLPKMVSGEWSGTMCLTEPHCGTDLGLLRTKAVPQQDGTYKITGSKIFISAGEQDLTSNIIHLVLARLPDAPQDRCPRRPARARQHPVRRSLGGDRPEDILTGQIACEIERPRVPVGTRRTNLAFQRNPGSGQRERRQRIVTLRPDRGVDSRAGLECEFQAQPAIAINTVLNNAALHRLNRLKGDGRRFGRVPRL